MQALEKIAFGNYYHIYNRGVNGCNIFRENANYEYFLSLFYRYTNPFTEIFAWVLMPNHFHFALRIKSEKEVTEYLANYMILNPGGNISRFLSPSQQLSNFFNSYAQAYNKKFERKGNLFQKPLNRKLVDSEEYFRQLILYIHNNPVKHGFADNPIGYGWSSYLSYISSSFNSSRKEKVMSWFESQENFISIHDQYTKNDDFEKWLDL